jgi:hypothetical protein
VSSGRLLVKIAEHLGFSKGGKFIDQLSKYCLLKGKLLFGVSCVCGLQPGVCVPLEVHEDI